MTIEEAIKILSPNSESRLVRSIDGFLPTQKVLSALEIACCALRSQQTPAKLDRSRWEGCPNCNKWQVYGYRNYKPAYCRDCGKPLNEEAWAEMERRIGGNDGTTD